MRRIIITLVATIIISVSIFSITAALPTGSHTPASPDSVGSVRAPARLAVDPGAIGAHLLRHTF